MGETPYDAARAHLRDRIRLPGNRQRAGRAAVVPGLGATMKLTCALPGPEPLVISINEALLCAVQAHTLGAVTCTLAEAPAPLTRLAVADSV